MQISTVQPLILMKEVLKYKLHEVKGAVGVGNSSYIANLVLRFSNEG
jgi:hypothetical protein